MAFAQLSIELNANLQKLQGDLDKAQAISDQAFGRIQKSATGAGDALGNAANQADFSDLSKDAVAAASSLDQIKTSATGTGTAADEARTKLQAMFEEIDRKAGETFDSLEEKTKTVGKVGAVVAGAVAVGVLYELGQVFAAVTLRALETAAAVGKFGAGLITGESYQTKYIDSLIAANDRVKELQTSLGITAQSASALELALERIGTPKGDYTAVYTATEKAVASNVDAFNQLGVAYQDAAGKLLPTQTVIQNAAKVLDTYTAGLDRNAAAAALGLGSADKVAAAAKLNAQNFDEAGKRLQDYFLVIGAGSQAATAAYEQAMRDFRSESDLTAEGFKRAIADSTIPVLTELAELLKDGFPDAVGAFRETLTGVVAVFHTFEMGAKALYEIVSFDFAALDTGISTAMASINKAIHFDFSGAEKEVEAGSAAIEARFGLMLDNVTKNRDKAMAAIDLAAGKDSQNTPTMDDRVRGKTYFGAIDFGNDDKKAAATPNVDVAKKQLEQQLKQLEIFISDEKDLLRGRDDFLSLYYQRGDVAIADYFAIRKEQQDAYLAGVKKDYADEIAALQDYIAKTQGNGALSDDQKTARVTDAQTKIIEVRNKLRKVEQDANRETLKDWFANRAAVEQYQDGLKSLEAQIKAFSGDSAGAFSINFDQQNRERLRQLNAVRDSDSSTKEERNAAAQGIVDLDQIREQGIATAKLNDLSSARSVILGDLANQQARIDLAVQRGTKSELQGLADTSAANEARIALLEQMVEAYDKVAAASNNLQDRVNADALHVELERLKTQTHLVADAFNDAAKDVTANFFDTLSDNTKTTHQKITALLDDIKKRISKLGADAVGDVLFGKDGGLLKGLGDQVSAFFKPSDGSGAVSSAAASAGKAISSISGATSSNAALTTFSTTITAANAPMLALNEAATQAALALATLAGSGGGSSSSGLLSGILALTGKTGNTSGLNIGTGVQSQAVYSDPNFVVSANGNVFSGGSLMPFAHGGVINRPTIFPMARGGVGLMGEAGPEAIVPLRPTDRPYRDARGKLRVADGGGQQVVNNNYTTVNVPAPQNRDLSTARQHGEAIRRALR